MSNEVAILAGTAAAIAFVHTVPRPDRYLPSTVLARAGQGSGLKTAEIPLRSGIGHILASVALGFIGIPVGIAVSWIGGG